jgi:type IV pilus assembly protein PilM
MNLFAYNLLGLKPKAFGLEIENCSLKAAWIEQKRTKFEFISCGKKILPRGIIQAEQILDAQKLAAEIKNVMALAQPKSIRMKNVIFSIPEAKAFIRTIQIPKMTKKEAREAVKWETEANIPISVDKVYLDWQIIGTEGEMSEVLVVAIPKNIIDSYFQAVTLAGLVPFAVEVDIFATIRSLTASIETSEPILIADIGAENTSLAIVQNQIPYFTSSIPLSGNTFTEALQKELGISWEKAEETKFKFGMGKMEEEETLFKIFNPLIENLASEIEKSIYFFEESINSKVKVKKAILAGGAALLNQLPRYLASRLNMEVITGDPLPKIDISSFPFEVSPRDVLSYATAIGLALRGAEYEN